MISYNAPSQNRPKLKTPTEVILEDRTSIEQDELLPFPLVPILNHPQIQYSRVKVRVLGRDSLHQRNVI